MATVDILNFESEEGSATELGQSLLAGKQQRLAKAKSEQDRFAKKIAIARFGVKATKWSLDEQAKEFDISQAPLQNRYISTMESAKSMINVADVINGPEYGGNYANYLIDKYLPYAVQATQEKYPDKDARFWQAKARQVSEKYAKENAGKLEKAVTKAYTIPTDKAKFDAEFTKVKDYYVETEVGAALFKGLKTKIKNILDPESVLNSKRNIKNIENLPFFEKHKDFKKAYDIYQALFPETSELILDAAAKEAPFKYEKMELKFVQGATSTKLNKETGEYEETTSVIPVIEKLKVGADEPDVSIIEDKTLQESLTFTGLDAQMTKLLTDITGVGIQSLNPKGLAQLAKKSDDLKKEGNATPRAIQNAILELTAVSEYIDLAGISKQKFMLDNNTRNRWWEVMVERGFAQLGTGPDISPSQGYLTPGDYTWVDDKSKIQAKQLELDYESWASNEYDRLTRTPMKRVEGEEEEPSLRQVVNNFNDLFSKTDFYKGLSPDWITRYNPKITQSRDPNSTEYMKQQILTDISVDEKGRLKNPFPLINLIKWDDEEVIDSLKAVGWVTGDDKVTLDPNRQERQFMLVYEPKENQFRILPHKG
jgi:hypothetical protein